VVIKTIGLMVVVFCLTISLLRGIGYMDGDFIIPLILLSQLFILGYLFQILQLVAKDIIIRYTKSSTTPPPPIHTWN
jgi:hypothetical protein